MFKMSIALRNDSRGMGTKSAKCPSFDFHIVFEYDDLFKYGVVLRHSNMVFDKGYCAFGDKSIERLLL